MCVSHTQTHDSSPGQLKTSVCPSAAPHRSWRGQSHHAQGLQEKMGKLSAALGILVFCAAGTWGRFTACVTIPCLKPGGLVIMLPVIPQNARTFCIPRVCDLLGKSLGGGAGSLKPQRGSQIRSHLGFSRVRTKTVHQKRYRVKTQFGALFSHWVRRVYILYLTLCLALGAGL